MSIVKSLWIIVTGIIGLLFILAAFAGGMLFFINQESYKGYFLQQFEATIGQKLIVNGPVVLKLFPEPRLVLENAKLTVALKDTQVDISAEHFSFYIPWHSLFVERKQFNSIDAKNMNIQYTAKENLKENFHFDSVFCNVSISYLNIDISHLLMQIEKNGVSGKLHIKIGNDNIDITGQLSSKEWAIPHEENATKQNLNDFISKIYKISWLKNITGKVDITVDKLIWQEELLEKVHFDLTLKDNIFNITAEGKSPKIPLQSPSMTIEVKKDAMTANIQGKLSGGDLSAVFGFQNAVNIKLKLTQANASELIKLLHENAMLTGGTLDFTFEGHSRGTTLHDLIAHLSGQSFLSMKNLKILNQNIDIGHVDIFAAIMKRLKPENKNTTVECAAWRLQVREGVARANNTIALETSELYALGTGALDLKTQKLDFTFDLRPRSQLNLEIGSMDNVVYLKGTLANPRLEGSVKGLVREGGSLALGFATGGISLLAEKLYKIATQKSSPCQSVLSR